MARRRGRGGAAGVQKLFARGTRGAPALPGFSMTRILISGPMRLWGRRAAVRAACSGSERVSREEVLVSLTNDLIVPRFQDVAERMEALRSSTRALCAQPSAELLEDARGAWRDAREPWLRSQAMWFGPIMGQAVAVAG